MDAWQFWVTQTVQDLLFLGNPSRKIWEPWRGKPHAVDGYQTFLPFWTLFPWKLTS